MSEVQKNGAPDVWWGGTLVELKRGRDRLSEDQRKWHRHYFIRHRSWPMVVHYDGQENYFRLFSNYMEFDEWAHGTLQREPQFLPELNYCLRKEYAVAGGRRGRGITPEELEKARALREEGATLRAICAQLGVSKTTLVMKLKEATNGDSHLLLRPV